MSPLHHAAKRSHSATLQTTAASRIDSSTASEPQSLAILMSAWNSRVKRVAGGFDGGVQNFNDQDQEHRADQHEIGPGVRRQKPADRQRQSQQGGFLLEGFFGDNQMPPGGNGVVIGLEYAVQESPPENFTPHSASGPPASIARHYHAGAGALILRQAVADLVIVALVSDENVALPLQGG